MRGSPAARHYLPVVGGAEAACAGIERALTAALAAQAVRGYARYRSMMDMRRNSGGGMPRGFRRRFKLWRKEIRAALAIANDIAKIRALARAFPADLPLAIAVAGLPGKAPQKRSREISSPALARKDPRKPSKNTGPDRGEGEGGRGFSSIPIGRRAVRPRSGPWRRPAGLRLSHGPRPPPIRTAACGRRCTRTCRAPPDRSRARCRSRDCWRAAC